MYPQAVKLNIEDEVVKIMN